MFHRTPEKYLYQTSNIIEGNAELPYVTMGRETGWVTPGGYIIKSKKRAIAYARKMHHLMTDNIPKFNRKLF